MIQEVIQGLDTKLTIDSRIQFYAYKHLSSFVEANDAKGGSAIILDNISGEILAIASYPSYNPNSPKRQIKRNRALVDAFEPGSIIKPLALAKGIDMGILSNTQIIDTSPGFINLSGRMVSDPKNYNNLTVSEIIAKSSQVGASKVALMLGAENIITNSFDLTEISRYRRNWGVYRDRRPDLYEGILSLDGNQTNKTDYA